MVSPKWFNSKFQQKPLLYKPILGAGPILESKGMRAIFQKKDKKRTKTVKKEQKRAKYLKIWAKIYKI